MKKLLFLISVLLLLAVLPERGPAQITESWPTGNTKWINTAADGGQSSTLLGSANVTRLFGFVLNVPVTFSHIVFNVGIADTTAGSLCGAFADCYSVGIYNAENTAGSPTHFYPLLTPGSLMANCAAAAFNTAAVLDCTTAQGVLTLQPGAYYFAFTGNANVAALTTAVGNSFASNGVPTAGSATTNGVLNISITPPSDSWNLLTGRQMVFALHN